jgi:hypothetical protein
LPGAVADGVFVWMLQDEQVASAGDAKAETAMARAAASRCLFMACVLKIPRTLAAIAIVEPRDGHDLR